MVQPSVPLISPASFQSFGGLLRYLRKRAELSQRELALQVGYHYSYMSRIEGGEHRPDPATLMARFIPALGLEREPEWTQRLLDLAAADPGRRAPAARTVPEPEPEIEPGAAGGELFPDQLPVSLTPLLGRDEELAALLDLLGNPDVRLVTLVGPPGVGKTRLAVEAAAQAVGMFAHGLRFVDLAPVEAPAGMLPALAQALDVHEIPDQPPVRRLAEALRRKNLLLVLDNFEQLVEAAPQLFQLLSATEQVKVLATSRVPLFVAGERQFSVRPLDLPRGEAAPPGAPEAAAGLLDFSAVRLFVERAAAAAPGFQLTPENAASVVDLCRGLDGLPLAIELAAARVRALDPAVMLREFAHRFDWLAPNLGAARTDRQTLRGAIEWSHNLLSEKEQVLLRRLSVFSARRTVETARAICADESLGEGEVFDLLLRLADHSLLYTDTHQGEPNFQFLETIHTFAREKLALAGEEAEFRNRHLAYFAGLAERVEIEVEFENQTEWLDRCELELNNLRAAMDWALQDGADREAGLRLAASLGLFWYLHSHFVEGLERSRVFLERARAGADQAVLAKLLFRTADLHLHRAEFDAAVALSAEAAALSREIGDPRLLIWSLYVQGDVHRTMGDLEAAEARLSESIALCREIGYEAVEDIALLLLSTILVQRGELERAEEAVAAGLALAEKLADPWGIAAGLGTLGEIRIQRGDHEGAEDCLGRSLAASRIVGDKFIVGGTLVSLSALANLRGRYAESDGYAEEALGLFQQVGDETQQAYPLRLMGYAAVEAGNRVRARVLLRESLAACAALGHTGGQVGCLAGLALCALAEGDAAEAADLYGQAGRIVSEHAVRLQGPDRAAFEAAGAGLEARLRGQGVE